MSRQERSHGAIPWSLEPQGPHSLAPSVSQAGPLAGHVGGVCGSPSGNTRPCVQGVPPGPRVLETPSLQGAEPTPDLTPSPERAVLLWMGPGGIPHQKQGARTGRVITCAPHEWSQAVLGPGWAHGSWERPGDAGHSLDQEAPGWGPVCDHGTPFPSSCGSCRTPGCGWTPPPRYSSPCPWPSEDTSLSPATTRPGRLGLGPGAALLRACRAACCDILPGTWGQPMRASDKHKLSGFRQSLSHPEGREAAAF